MSVPKIFDSEYKFCLILWENEPVKSGKLVELCREKLGWSKATTYTVIKRLSERGVVRNENALVTSLISKEEVQASEVDELVDRVFEGSLPSFVAAFTRRKKLSAGEVEELRRMIDSYGEGGNG
ncbi:MAG: BlaI/MecI/CopY family transcriptional regulator [Oscillospiraceae bacterium]|nr:BlaI/MecI/CopY family transcriptional regulator [Oscillospiraceae bacterium]